MTEPNNQPYGQPQQDAYTQGTRYTADYGTAQQEPAPQQDAYTQQDAYAQYGTVGQPDPTVQPMAGAQYQQPYAQPEAGTQYQQPQYQAPYQQPAQGYYQPYASAPAPAAPRYNGLAIAGFVCSFFLDIVGLVLSIIGYTQVRRTGEKGKELAIAGIVISGVKLVASIVGIVLILVGMGAALDEYDNGNRYYYETSTTDSIQSADRTAADPLAGLPMRAA